MKTPPTKLPLFGPVLFWMCFYANFALGQDHSAHMELPATVADSLAGWTVHRLSRASLINLPDKEFISLPLLNSGITDLNGNLHFRGSRANEIAYFLNGINVTNPFFNTNGIPLITEAIERMDIHTGAYGAQLGGANGGLVNTSLRKGGEQFEFNTSLETDDFARPGDSFLGASPNGYKRLVTTFGGPLLGINYFIAAQHKYQRNKEALFLEPFTFDSLLTDGYGNRPPGMPLPSSVEFKRNYLYNNWDLENTVHANFSIPLRTAEIRLLGSYDFEETPQGGEWPSALENYFRQQHNMMNEVTTNFGAIQFLHQPTPELSYSFSFSGYNRFARLYDPDFGDEWQLYVDSLAYYEKGFTLPSGSTEFMSRFSGPPSYTTIINFPFRHPNFPNTFYRKNRQSSLSFASEVNVMITPYWKTTLGGTVDWWSMREYAINSITGFHSFINAIANSGNTLTEYEKRVNIIRQANMDFYGYSYDGAETDDGLDAPRKPRFSSFFLNNRITHEGLTINFGGRYETFHSGVTRPLLYDPKTDEERALQPFDESLNLFDEDTFIERKTARLFLPRISVAFQATEGVSWYAAFGKYAQYTPLENLYLGNVRTSSPISPRSRVGYWLGSSFLPGFFADPERSTQYELGSTFTLLKRLPVSVKFYYKSLTNQLQLGHVYNTLGQKLFVALLNQGDGVSKGIEFSLELARTENVFVLAHYAYADARGRTSDPFWNRRDVSDAGQFDEPQYLIPFDFSRTHRFVGVVQYTHQDQSLPVFDGIGFTALFTVQSGRRYTKLQEIRNLGAASPWNIGVRPVIDARTAYPDEPYNGSTTPLFVNLDLHIRKAFSVGGVQTEFFISVLNTFNTKHILNVFPTTGSTNDDSWLGSEFSSYFTSIPRYTEFYSTINLKNHWAYAHASGNSMYGKPMQIRAGVTISI